MFPRFQEFNFCLIYFLQMLCCTAVHSTLCIQQTPQQSVIQRISCIVVILEQKNSIFRGEMETNQDRMARGRISQAALFVKNAGIVVSVPLSICLVQCNHVFPSYAWLDPSFGVMVSALRRARGRECTPSMQFLQIVLLD